MAKEFILPKEIPLDRYPGPEVFLAEGKRIVEAAKQAGFPLRVMGPLALHYYFPDLVGLYAKLERLGERYFTDIDFVGYAKSGGKLKGFFEKLGYECELNTLMTTGKTRQIYYGGAVPMIDVFLDKLDYCHEVDFKGAWSSTTTPSRSPTSCCRSCRSGRSTTKTSKIWSSC